jgi:hypothetical protein
MIAGYFSFGDQVPQFIVLREAPSGYNDIMMTIGLFGLMIGMFIGTTIRINCNKNTSKCLQIILIKSFNRIS